MKLLPTALRGAARSAVPTIPSGYVGDPLVRIESDAGPLWMPASDGVMRPYLESRGTWEEDEGRLLRSMFRPGLHFLDVGANLGYFSLLVARHCPGATIHAFEPHPYTSSILALNAWAAHADITTYALALSDGDRLLALSTAPSNLGDTRTASEDHATMLVPAAALDEIIPDAVFDLVKIDVQGFETEVIAGMVGMLQRSPEVVVVAEFWPTALRERGLDPLAVLRNYRELGLTMKVQVAAELGHMQPRDVVRVCDEAGPYGQVNLVLTRDASLNGATR